MKVFRNVAFVVLAIVTLVTIADPPAAFAQEEDGLTEKALLSDKALSGDALLRSQALLVDAESLRAQAEEAEHNKLRALRDLAEKAINTNNLDLFKPHLAEKFAVVTYTDREFEDFEAFKARWQKSRDELLGGGTYTTKLNPELSVILGDIALARGNSDNVMVTEGGQRFEFTSHWSAVLQKDANGDWKILRAHSSLSPFENPIMRANVKSILIKVGAGALAVGLLVGWLAAVYLRRRT